MSKRMLAVGLAILCVSAFGVISSSSASAGAWLYTCVEHAQTQQGQHKYIDEDCTKQDDIEGEYGHVAITELTTLDIHWLENAKLTGKLFGANVELEATGATCVECTIENKEVGGVKEATGSGKLKLTGVTAVGLPKCSVNGGTITTEPLKFTNTSTLGETLEPATGTTVAKFNITGSGCTVAGENIKVTGKAFAAAEGAIQTANVTKASNELQLEGEKASLKFKITLTVGKDPKVKHHPVSYTLF